MLIKKPTISNIARMASGILLAQIITLIATPVITRLYGAELYGEMGLFLSYGQLLAPVAAACLPIGIVLAKDDKEAEELLYVSVVVSIILSVSVGIFLLIASAFGLLSNIDVTTGWLIAGIPTFMLGAGVFQSVYQYRVRQAGYKKISLGAVYSSLSLNFLKLSLSYTTFATVGLLVAASLTHFVHSICLMDKSFLVKKSLRSLKDKGISALLRTRKVLVNYRDLILYRAPEALLSAASVSLPVVIFSLFFSSTYLGYYVLAKMILKVPNTLLLRAVGDVLYPKLNTKKNQGGNVYSYLFKVTLTLGLISSILYAFVAAFGPYMFELLFGEGWYVAGEVARGITLWMVMSIASAGTLKAVSVFGMHKSLLNYRILAVIGSSSTIYLTATGEGGFIDTVYALSAVNALFILSYIIYVLFRIKNIERTNYEY